MQSTPLLLACKEGNTRCLESLVGYGADLSISDERDGTPLHFILAKSSMKPLSEWTPHLNKVDSLTHSLTHLIHNFFVHVSQFHEEYVSGADNSIQDVPVYITVACFLVSEGASLEARSFEGFSPLDLCLTQHRPLLQLFARPERYSTYTHTDTQVKLHILCRRGHYRGSLPRHPPPVPRPTTALVSVYGPL